MAGFLLSGLRCRIFPQLIVVSPTKSLVTFLGILQLVFIDIVSEV